MRSPEPREKHWREVIHEARALGQIGWSLRGKAVSVERDQPMDRHMSKKIDIAALAPVVGTLYPPPFDEPCLSRERRKLGDAAGLTQFGVNLLRLPPGAWSSQRHWHTESDEFVYVLSGEVTLLTDAGPETLRPGDAAGFKAGDTNGHCLQNRSSSDATVLEIGTRVASDAGHYSDIDMFAPAGGKPAIYTRKDGAPYADIRRRAKQV
jgi:uncharacterized cupin superfamily protein